MKGINITYEIDNHSEIMPIGLFVDCISDTTHWRKRTKKYIVKGGLIGCYIFYDDNKNIIYIGKSSNCIRQRMNSHITAEPSQYLRKYEEEHLLMKRKHYKYFSYIEIDKQMVDFVERGLINKFQPIFNIEFTTNTKK